jgi:cobalt/nickel transport system permease protein
VLLLVRLLLKALISVTFSLFFLMTTRYNYFSTMIYRIFPSPVDQVFLMAYRFIFLTLKMVDAMVKALRSRGSGLIAGAAKQGRLFAEVFALVFIRSYDRADRINKAMESRGFSGKYVAATKIPPMQPADYAFAAAALGVTGLAMLGGW